jgi:hypothetical protein
MYYTFKRVSHILYERSLEDSANYVEQNMPNALVFFDESKKSMYDYAISNISFNGFVGEFGVFKGQSINYVAKQMPNQTIYGFDSFLGLSEDWLGWELPKGTFNLNGIMPEVEENVELVKGFFNESLPVWVKDNKDPFSLLIIDSDLYSSACTILDTLGNKQIIPGTLILFDEYFGHIGWRNNEFKAWQEFVKKHKIKYEYLAINHLQALVRVIE